MESQLNELRHFGDYMAQHGQYVVRAMLILVLGLIAAGLTWSAAFALFVVRYGPMLLRPRISS